VFLIAGREVVRIAVQRMVVAVEWWLIGVLTSRNWLLVSSRPDRFVIPETLTRAAALSPVCGSLVQRCLSIYILRLGVCALLYRRPHHRFVPARDRRVQCRLPPPSSFASTLAPFSTSTHTVASCLHESAPRNEPEEYVS
jgi:hypothetical protein